mmetsp:Transcript_40219/g.89261  ORF Transcript_40219/g.89261 Transcript_40219/m.89261 type:complete len:89 (-) Transcript_40219:1089-1355(-)
MPDCQTGHSCIKKQAMHHILLHPANTSAGWLLTSVLPYPHSSTTGTQPPFMLLKPVVTQATQVSTPSATGNTPSTCRTHDKFNQMSSQ